MCKSGTMWVVGLVLMSCGISCAANQYGDYGITLTALPFTLDGYKDIVVIPTTPLEIGNYTGSYNGINFNDINKQFLACDVDYDNNHLYLYDYDSRSLVVGENWNSSAIMSEITWSETHNGLSSDYIKIAVDWVSHNVYWTDPLMGWIAMQPGGAIDDPTKYKVLITNDMEYPVGIAVDPLSGYLFWTDNGDTPKIMISNLIGEEQEPMVVNNLKSIYSIVADHATERIFWTDHYSIDSIKYDKTGRKHIRRNSYSFFFDLAIFQDVIMTTDINEYYLHFFNKSTGVSVAEKDGSAKEAYFGICMYHPDNQPTPAEQDRCKSHGCEHMCVNEPTKATCLCKEGFNLNEDGKTCTEAEGKHYRGIVLNTGHELCIIDIRVILDHQDHMPTCFYNGTENETISHIELNMKTREVYFSVGKNIYRVKIDKGPNNRTLLTSQEKNITGLSYDWINNHLYYSINETKGTPDSIWIMDPDTLFTQKHQNNTGDFVRGLLVVPHEGKVFWLGNPSDAVLFESDLGINPGSVTSINVDGLFFEPISMIHGLKDEQLYVLDIGFFENHDIVVLHYNGSYRDYLELDTTVYDIATYKEYLVFVQQSGDDTILRSVDPFLGTPDTVAKGKVKGLKNVYGLKVLDIDLQPTYPSPCGNTQKYGGCEQICIPNGNQSMCACTLGFNLHENGTNCVSEPVTNDFLLVADRTYEEVLQIPLAEPQRAIGIKTPDVGRPAGIMYNYLTDKIIWASEDEAQVMSVHLNGTNDTIFSETYFNFGYPDRFALDPSTGIIYYTAVSYFADQFRDSFIGVIDDKGRDTIIHSDNHRPRGIVLHPAMGKLYITDHGDEAGIYRANMDGSNMEHLISEDIVWPNGLAIDYDQERLYWADGYLDKIFSCDLEGEDRIEVLHDPKSHMMDLVLLGDYLYYSAWDKTFITKVHKLNSSDVTNIGPASGLGRVQGLAIYSKGVSDMVPKNTLCATNNGGCSDFCLPTSTGVTCACDGWYDLLADGKTCENTPRCPKSLSSATVTDSDTCLRLPGNKCNFTCEENHRRKPGVLLITCTDEKDEDFEITELYKWDNDEPCEEILCLAMPPNGYIDEEKCDRSVGSKCEKFTCAPGYERNTSLASVTCLPTGQWDMQNSMCLERCPVLNLNTNNAQLIADCVRQPGEECMFFCNNMYTNAQPFSKIRCNPGSQWNVSANSLCKEIVCQDFIPNGIINNTCSRKHLVNCSFTCMNNNRQNPAIKNIQCKNGVWDLSRENMPCIVIPPPAAEKQNTAQNIGIGVGVGALVILLIIIILVVFLYRAGKIPFKSYKANSGAHTSFENPRYVAGDDTLQSSGRESNKDFGYTTLQEDTVRVNNEFTNTNLKAASSDYDNIDPTLQPKS